MQFDRDLVAARIRGRRAELDMTQEEVTDLAGGLGGANSLSLYESGKSLPNVENLAALAHALCTTPNYLLGWDEPPN